jgi:hypothetical protein
MIESTRAELTDAVSRFAVLKGEKGERADVEFDNGLTLPAFDFGTRRVVLCSTTNASEVETAFRKLPESFNDPHLYEVVVGVDGVARNFRKVLARGIQAVSLHSALAELVGLPEGALDAQIRCQEQALQSLRFGEEYQIAPLRLCINGSQHDDAQAWLHDALSWKKSRISGKLLYLRAEAGKGKSTVFANLAKTRLGSQGAPLTLYIPLRQVERRYVSWNEIAGIVGAVGSHAQDLSMAAKAGLVAFLLDGLDEVAGRYDPNVVSEVLEIALANLVSEHSLVAISGRTTEATLLDRAKSVEADLELPASDSEAFRQYTNTVVKLIAPSWPRIAARLPEPSHGPSLALPDREITEVEAKAIEEWIKLRFEELGKEKSLFFVQSLACIGRTNQLDGNRPLVINGQPIETCSVADVCLLAASLACAREQDKIESIAREYFMPSPQLDVLTRFAVLASADPETRQKLEKPNVEAQRAFRVDPMHENEEFTAIIRQLQKHALLFAGTDSPAAGDWKPYFLSDWIRCVLLLRAWEKSNVIEGEDRVAIRFAIARAQRAGLLYSVLIPELCRNHPEELSEIVDAVLVEAESESPEACFNFWAMEAGLDDTARRAVERRPQKMVEMTDLSTLDFEALDFGKDFQCNLVFAVGVKFVDCKFGGSVFTECDLTGAYFESCSFDEVHFNFCDGPIKFYGCRFSSVGIRDLRSKELPAAEFINCEFGDGCVIEQSREPGAGAGYGPIARFESCVWNGAEAPHFVGEWLGGVDARVLGLERKNGYRRPSSEECLHRLLRPFFPSAMGEGGNLQSRGYTRLSAIGRGVMPIGAPSASSLRGVLESEGFDTGGRSDHLYAPWSSVLGGGAPALVLRNELLAFLRSGTIGGHVKNMLKRIEHQANWAQGDV